MDGLLAHRACVSVPSKRQEYVWVGPDSRPCNLRNKETAPPTAPQLSGKSAFSMACNLGNLQLVQLLLARGANVNTRWFNPNVSLGGGERGGDWGNLGLWGSGGSHR